MHGGRERTVENADLIGGGGPPQKCMPAWSSRKLPVRTIKVNLSLVDICGVDFSVNPLFALDVFICSFHKCIQHTMRGQSKFPLSKL